MYNGIINIYKEAGYTSHDVVAKLRGIVRQRKIGHTGTLDPDAVGVLPVCLGKATKLCDMLTDGSKVYETVMLLGQETDTQDITGRILQEYDTSGLNEEKVKDSIYSFIGSYEQIPPMYSALKVNGQKLVDLARQGLEVERKARMQEIFSIEILSLQLPRVSMRVSCSKGTYIRTLCHDIGKKLGIGACMESLIRCRADRFDIKYSLRLSEVESLYKEGGLEEYILPVDDYFDFLEAYKVKEEYNRLALNGNKLKPEYLLDDFKKDVRDVRIYDCEGRFIGIYTLLDGEILKPHKLFIENISEGLK